MLKRLLGEDIALKVDFSSNVSLVHADPGMMEQILLNLAVNSRDAMPRGGELMIATSDVIIDGDYVRRNADASVGPRVSLSVRDTGEGISPDVLPRIFEPFFTTKEVGKGTGLGLATVYGIVQQHRGWITVNSEAGKGTTFEIFLPSSGRVRAASEPRQSKVAVRGGTERILLVEDEADVRMLMRSVLERHGYRVIDAASGPLALQVWDQDPEGVNLLVTDIVMPDGMTGKELASTLKAKRPELKVIFTSGYSADVVAKDFVLESSTHFLQKPFSPRSLAEIVRRVLDGPDGNA
jgi:CheY-like chemotaxis protein